MRVESSMTMRPPKHTGRVVPAVAPLTPPPSSSSKKTADHVYKEVRARLRSPPTSRRSSFTNATSLHRHDRQQQQQQQQQPQVDSNHHQCSATPPPPHRVLFQPVSSSFSDSRGTTISTSLSGSSGTFFNAGKEPVVIENANIMRGAQILREQYLQNSFIHNHHHNHNHNHTTTSTSSNMHHTDSRTVTPIMQNKSQPLSPTATKSKRSNKPPQTNHRWNVVAPKPERLFPSSMDYDDVLRDLMTEIPNMKNTLNTNHSPSHRHAKAMKYQETVRASDSTHNNTRQLIVDKKGARNEDVDAFTVDPTTGGVILRDMVKSNDVVGNNNNNLKPVGSEECDNDDAWNNRSLHSNSILMGPVPALSKNTTYHDGGKHNNSMTKSQKNNMSSSPRKEEILDKTLDTTMSNEVDEGNEEDLAVLLLQQAEQMKNRGQNTKQYVQAAAQAAAEDAEAFDNFIDSVSLNDQVPTGLINHKEEIYNEMDPVQLAAAKRHAMMSMVGQRMQPRQTQQQHSRGRNLQRSFSAAGREITHHGSRRQHPTNRQSSRRTCSMGAERRRQNHAKSSLRDDLMCGLEKNCGPLTEEEIIAASQADDGCGCAPIQDRGSIIHHYLPSKQSSPHQESRGFDKLRQPSRQTRDPSNRFVKQQHHQHHRAHEKIEDSEHASKNISAFKLDEDDKFHILAPNSQEYMALRTHNPAFQHAMNAGTLWQSLVGQSVRFPKEWWQGGHRTAPLGCNDRIAERNRWTFYDRHRIRGNTFLNKFIKRRDEPGQILIHLILRDFMTASPILDIVVGCFHPNAKSIRTTEVPNKRNKECRDVWLATRFRTEDSISVIDPVFLNDRLGQPLKSPLGNAKRRITNANVRSIYGESPPLRTVFVLEDEIYEALTSTDASQSGVADVLLRKYLFRY